VGVLDDLLGIKNPLMNVTGVNAHGAKQHGAALCRGQNAGKGFPLGGNRQGITHTRRLSAGQNISAIKIKIRKIQMAMAVN
jgi:hypothetical protein